MRHIIQDLCHLHVPIYTKIHGKMWPSDTNSLCKSISVETSDLRSPAQAAKHVTRTLFFQGRHDESSMCTPVTGVRNSPPPPKKKTNKPDSLSGQSEILEGCVFTTARRFCTYLLTYLLTPWSRVLLEKLTGSQLLKKFSAFCGTRKFITSFTRARHLSLP